MASESELIERLREILRASDLSKTTTSIVRRRLEEEFGIDLSEKKPFVRQQVVLFLNNEFEKSEDEDDDEDGGDRTVENPGSEQTNGSDSKHDDDNQASRNGKRKKSSNKAHNKLKKSGDDLGKICRLSAKLKEFIGVPEMARTEVVKQIWEYIGQKNLQDPTNKQNIFCDEPMRSLFGVDSINMLQINKALSAHISSVDLDKVVPTNSSLKVKRRKKKREVSDEAEEKNIRKRGKWGFLAPLQLSDALASFLATGENVLARSDVIKRMWVYIKEHNLQDPVNKKRVICDNKLRDLFGVESFDGFTVTKHLSAHFIKA